MNVVGNLTAFTYPFQQLSDVSKGESQRDKNDNSNQEPSRNLTKEQEEYLDQLVNEITSQTSIESGSSGSVAKSKVLSHLTETSNELKVKNWLADDRNIDLHSLEQSVQDLNLESVRWNKWSKISQCIGSESGKLSQLQSRLQPRSKNPPQSPVKVFLHMKSSGIICIPLFY